MMKTVKHFKQQKKLKLTQFRNFWRDLGKLELLKIAAQAFKAGGFLNIS